MKTIVFDFGNVLAFFDHRITLSRLAPYTDMSGPEIYDIVYRGELEDAFESGQLSVPEFLVRFRQRCRLTCDDAFLQPAIADIFTPNEAVVALVPRLAERYRLVLGSNTNAIHAEHFVQQFRETLQHFHALVLSNEIGARKPKRAFFEECVHRANCQPGECVFIDDLPANVAGAQACGMQGIVYDGRVDLTARLAEMGIRCY